MLYVEVVSIECFISFFLGNSCDWCLFCDCSSCKLFSSIDYDLDFSFETFSMYDYKYYLFLDFRRFVWCSAIFYFYFSETYWPIKDILDFGTPVLVYLINIYPTLSAEFASFDSIITCSLHSFFGVPGKVSYPVPMSVFSLFFLPIWIT